MAASCCNFGNVSTRSRVLHAAFLRFCVPVEQHAVLDHVAHPLAASNLFGELSEFGVASILVRAAELDVFHSAVILKSVYYFEILS